MPQYSPTVQVICSDVRKGLSRLNDSSVDTVVTSPPYYGQRDYESDIQIGHEKTIEDYVDTLVEIFGAVRRVLRPEGTLWLNLGDKYLNGQLQGLPWRVALALQADGWVLRSDIIWHKPNAMPSAVKNRPTTDHEYIFLLTRSTKDYYYDADAIREPHVTFTNQSRMKGGRKHWVNEVERRRQARTVATPICTMGDGIRRFTRRDETNGRSGPCLCQNIEMLISRFSRNRSSNIA